MVGPISKSAIRRMRRKNKVEEGGALAAIDESDSTASNPADVTTGGAATRFHHSVDEGCGGIPTASSVQNGHGTSAADKRQVKVPAASSVVQSGDVPQFRFISEDGDDQHKQVGTFSASAKPASVSLVHSDVSPAPSSISLSGLNSSSAILKPVPPPVGMARELFEMLLGSTAVPAEQKDSGVTESSPPAILSSYSYSNQQSVTGASNTTPTRKTKVSATLPSSQAPMEVSAVVRLSSALGLNHSGSSQLGTAHNIPPTAHSASSLTNGANSATISESGGSQYYKSKSGFIVRL